MASKEQAASSGISFAGLLTVPFIVLKLCDVIDWSWIWVLSPLWIGIAAILGVMILVFVLGVLGIAIGSAVQKKKKNNRR